DRFIVPRRGGARLLPCAMSTPMGCGRRRAPPLRKEGALSMLILYNPQSSAGRKKVLPMSLLAVGSLLEGEHDYMIIDGNAVPDAVAAIDHAIRDTGADILAVTVMPGPQISHAVAHCPQIKAMHPNLT